MPAFEQGKLSRKNAIHMHEQIKLVKKKLGEKTCSLYTRTSKASKELVKVNLVVCPGLNLNQEQRWASVICDFSQR